MIHRFVDLLEELVLDRAMIWNVKQQSGGTDRLFGLGVPPTDLALYLGESRVAVTQWTLNHPVLSPDLSEYVYIQNDTGAPGTNRTMLRLCASDDLSPPVTLATNPSGGVAVTGRIPQPMGWSPDGQKIYWRGVVSSATNESEIRRINRDGTGNTQIWASGGAPVDSAFGFYPRISPDGTMLAFWSDFGGGAAAGLWVMNEDGTGVSHIYTPPDSGGEEPDDFYGWSPDSEWLLFRDTDWSVSPRVENIYKIRSDGTGLTTLASPVAGVDPQIFVSQGQYSVWLDDASGIVCALENATPGNGDVGILLADGSETFTPLSPTREIDYVAFYADGPIMNSDYTRIYWYEDAALGVGNMKVVSAKVDGSDYRVDDDMVTPSTHDDYLAIGFYVRSS